MWSMMVVDPVRPLRAINHTVDDVTVGNIDPGVNVEKVTLR